MRSSKGNQLLTLLLLGLNPSWAQGPDTCQDFTVGNCNITDVPINEITNAAMTADMCQFICNSLASCRFFRYLNSGLCQAFRADFRKNCKVVGGSQKGEVEDCVSSDLTECNGFVEEDCTYGGQNLGFDPPDGEITSPLGCETYCIGFSFLGCNYWVFDSDTNECHLLESSQRDCVGMTGPQAPTIDECAAETTTVPITTAIPCGLSEFEPTDYVDLQPIADPPPEWSWKDGELTFVKNEEASVAYLVNEYRNIQFNGTFQTLDSDDDLIGVVVGFQNSSNLYLIVSSGNKTTDHPVQYQVPWSIIKVASSTGASTNAMIAAVVSGVSVPGQTEVLYTWPDKRWVQGTIYSWSVEYRAGDSLMYSMWEQGGTPFLEPMKVDLIAGGEDDLVNFGIFARSQPSKFFGLQYTCI